MKFNESWLKEYVSCDLDGEQIGARLTLAGLELDGIEPVASDFTGLVVARIESLEPHPDAEKLRICRVNDGQVSDLQVICGAANARAGMYTVLATVGARLPGLTIKKAKLRGVESFGMLCSMSELGMTESSSGILELPEGAPVGADIREYLQLNDQVLDVDLTPNRADCFSLRGIAREMKVLLGAPVNGFDTADVAAVHDEQITVSLMAEEACPRYLSRIVKGVNLGLVTPLWMAERLRRTGIRSLNPVVDVTNYVMLELGQPMHAFDLSRVSGGIVVRYSKDGERLQLLDGKDIALSDEALVIADESGPLALAGIMGGESSAVSGVTTDILLEAAYFNPLSLAGKARHYGLHTESSHRFERGVDFELARQAMERATALILELVGGQPGPVVEAVAPSHLPVLPTIVLRRPQIGRRLGIELPDDHVSKILTDLGCDVSGIDGGWNVVPPSFRFDLRIEVDLIEELARVHGYDKIPATSRSWSPMVTATNEGILPINVVKQNLVDIGYQEVVTYSFVDAGSEKLLNPEHKGLTLANPISADLSVMRSSLWSGLLKVVSHNQRRQQARIRIFETGLVFLQSTEGLSQPARIAGVLAGEQASENWIGEHRDIDFFDLKADVEVLFELSGIKEAVVWESAEHSALHPGQSARLTLNGREIGWAGAVHPNLLDPLQLERAAYVFEIHQDVLSSRTVPRFHSLSRFPSVRRDLALLVGENVTYDKIKASISSLDLTILKSIHVFDVYRGQGVANGLKSVALGLILQDFSRTLEDSDVEPVIDQILSKLADDVGASLRV